MLGVTLAAGNIPMGQKKRNIQYPCSHGVYVLVGSMQMISKIKKEIIKQVKRWQFLEKAQPLSQDSENQTKGKMTCGGSIDMNKRAYGKREKPMEPILFLFLSTLTTMDYDKPCSFSSPKMESRQGTIGKRAEVRVRVGQNLE